MSGFFNASESSNGPSVPNLSGCDTNNDHLTNRRIERHETVKKWGRGVLLSTVWKGSEKNMVEERDASTREDMKHIMISNSESSLRKKNPKQILHEFRMRADITKNIENTIRCILYEMRSVTENFLRVFWTSLP